MPKKLFLMLAALLLMVTGALADDGRGVLSSQTIAAPAVPQAVAQAVTAELPDASPYYALEEYDDGEKEWEVFFTTTAGGLGSCTVKEGSYKVRDVERYDDVPAGALLVTEALEKLQAEKGGLVATELEMDRERGQICYEGQGLLDGREYEFVITVEGKILEWERD